jgi:hypothetical protein
MANIRIKDLSTTASSTASDDFFGVDGATNGTRKLDAYSPTFGGNLTVNGGTVNFSGSGSAVLNWQNGPNTYATTTAYAGSGELRTNIGPSAGWGGFITWHTDTTEKMRLTNAGNLTLAGNLTVSGTGNSSIGGTLLVNGASPSGNGAIQLATHTTSAGGIGFGTDISLYRSGSDQLSSYSSGTANNIFLRHSTTSSGGFQMQIDSSKDVYLFQRENRPMYLGTNNVTALTLDSSQRCILAGALRLNNAYTAGAPTATGYVTLQDSAGNTYKVLVGT